MKDMHDAPKDRQSIKLAFSTSYIERYWIKAMRYARSWTGDFRLSRYPSGILNVVVRELAAANLINICEASRIWDISKADTIGEDAFVGVVSSSCRTQESPRHRGRHDQLSENTLVSCIRIFIASSSFGRSISVSLALSCLRLGVVSSLSAIPDVPGVWTW